MRLNPWEKLVKYHQDHELVWCFFPMSIAIMLSLGSLRGSYWHHHERSHSSNWGNVYTLKALRAHFYTFRERLIIHYQTTAESKPPTSWQSLPVRLDICFAALDTKLGRNQQTDGQYSFLLSTFEKGRFWTLHSRPRSLHCTCSSCPTGCGCCGGWTSSCRIAPSAPGQSASWRFCAFPGPWDIIEYLNVFIKLFSTLWFRSWWFW